MWYVDVLIYPKFSRDVLTKNKIWFPCEIKRSVGKRPSDQVSIVSRFAADWLRESWCEFSRPITQRKEVKPMIGPGNSHHFRNQSESKLKPIATWSSDFSSTSDGLISFDIFPSSGWLLCLPQFGFTPLNHKALNKYFSIKPLCKDLCSDSSLPDRWRRPVAVHET